MSCFSHYLLYFSSTKSENKRGEIREQDAGGSQIIYTHVSKCKNDKNKITKKTLVLSTSPLTSFRPCTYMIFVLESLYMTFCAFFQVQRQYISAVILVFSL
jgi:hypothetical protein